jgi:hypothetical protein
MFGHKIHEAEIAINNVPRGVEILRSKAVVCEKALRQLAARHGMTLTVYGTYKNNQPFKKTYGRQEP